MLLANILITFPIKYNPVFSNGPKNPPDCPILRNSFEESSKHIRHLEICKNYSVVTNSYILQEIKMNKMKEKGCWMTGAN